MWAIEGSVYIAPQLDCTAEVDVNIHTSVQRTDKKQETAMVTICTTCFDMLKLCFLPTHSVFFCFV
jgi:hypothetical protein